MDLEAYYAEFMQEIYARSGAQSDFSETVFTDKLCDFLVDQAILEDYTSIGFRKTSKGIRVDAANLNEETEVLTLLVTDFRFSNDMESLTKSDTNKNFKRAEKFFRESLDRKYYESLEESSPAYELAREIFENKSQITRVNFALLSNANLSKRVSDFDEQEAGPYRSTYTVWDISRLHRLETSGMGREQVVVDFEEITRGGIRCLAASTNGNAFESYLFVLPGDFVAGLYDQYGERLLEQNVRTFLQFRGKVNKGIRNTIKNEPEMFFAYNNGLTATAEHIETNSRRSRIVSAKNFQIVNGGQTIASIFTSKRKLESDLSNVRVQVKLSVIPPEAIETIVPRISEYANTQNKVSAADFFSNHPFHLRIEELSRRLWAPSPEGGLRETHWFYERARGQFANAQANLTPAKKKEFLSLNPRHQMFTKTDLAKFDHSAKMLPQIVSRGAQKNFALFASKIGSEWDRDDAKINELYFQRLIAKALLFRYLDRNIMKQNWYGGYKANIVTYSVAKLVHMLSSKGRHLDLSKIWLIQKLSPALEMQLMTIAENVNSDIQNPPEMYSNVTEWCKRDLCWERIAELKIPLSTSVFDDCIDAEELEDRDDEASDLQEVDSGIRDQEYVLEKGADYWKALTKFATEKSLLNQKEKGILAVACEMPLKIPTEKQSEIIRELETALIEEGFYLEPA